MGRKHCRNKGETTRYEQFLLFPLCFQEGCFPGASKGVIVWEWVKLINVTSDIMLPNCFEYESSKSTLTTDHVTYLEVIAKLWPII